MNFSAKYVHPLTANANLTPGKGQLKEGSNGIKALHCIFKPEGDVTFRTVGGSIQIFPSSAFVVGAIYPYEIVQINESGAKAFLGLSD